MGARRREPTPGELELVRQLPDAEAARRIGVNRATVARWRLAYGIPNPYLTRGHDAGDAGVPQGSRPVRRPRVDADDEVRAVLSEVSETARAESSSLRVEVHESDCAVVLDRDVTVVVLSDLHLPEADPDAMLLAREIVRVVDPDLVVLNGDLLDVFALTSWPASPERRSFAQEIAHVREQVVALTQWAPRARWVWIHGNHELRFVRYLWRRASELWQLDDLDLGRIVRVPSDWVVLRHVEGYRRRTEYAAPQVRIGRLYVMHGDTIRSTGSLVNVARTIYLKLLRPVIVGHWHRAQVYLQTDYAGQTSGAWAAPCLTGPRAHYGTDRVMDQGIVVVYASRSGLFEVQLVPFLAEAGQLRALLHGRLYARQMGAGVWW